MFVGVGIGVGRQRFGGGFIGLLDLYPSASVAYSLRRLSGNYTGNPIRVRRASDNAEQNIGFDALGNLDTTALTTFCTGTNGFVTTWYDQSGNGLNLTQTNGVNQPQIVSSGSVLLLNSKPTINFDGVNDSLFNNNAFATPSNVSWFFLESRITGIQNSRHFMMRNSTNNITQLREILATTSPCIIRTLTDNQNATGPSPDIALNTQTLISSIEQIAYVNSTIVTATNNSTTGYGTGNGIYIARRSDDVNYSNISAQELIVYFANQSANQSNIDNNINTYYNVY